VRLDQWEIEATLDPQVHLVSRAFLVLQGKKVPRVTQVLLVQQVKMAHLDQEASPEREVCPALWGRTV